MNDTLTCPACGESNAGTFVTCGRCRQPLDGSTPAWRDDLRKLQDEKAKDDHHRDGWAREMRKRHAITGAITLFLLLTVPGLPQSAMPLALVQSLVLSLLLGVPAGYLISRQRGGMLRGAATGLVLFLAIRMLLGTWELARGAALVEVFASALGWGLGGLVPGAIIGISVEIDD